MLRIEQETWGSQYRPSAQQLRYQNDTEPEFVHGGEVELSLKVDGVEKVLSGATLITALGSDSRISLPDGPGASHFTLIAGGSAYLDGVSIPRPIRGLMAWDLHHLLSHLGSDPEPLPDSHEAARTFQELLVKFYIERLGVNRGPGGRRDRLHGDLRVVKEIADDDYLDEMSIAAADLTTDEKFWRGVSPEAPPWRFLWVAGQSAQFTVHAGRDSLAGHLAERAITRLFKTSGQFVWRKDENDGKYHREPLASESELEAADPDDDSLADGVANRLELEAMLGVLRDLPGFEFFRMQQDGLKQAQIAEQTGVSQARVSQRIKQFKAAALDRFPGFRPK